MKTTLLRLLSLLIVFSMMVSPVQAMGSMPDTMLTQAVAEEGDLPVLTSTDLAGNYTAGLAQVFEVNLTNPSSTESYEIVVYYELTAEPEDLISLQFMYDIVDGSPVWADLPTQENEAGDKLVGIYGPETGGLPIGPGYNFTQPFRIALANAGEYDIEMQLLDVSGETPVLLDELEATLTVYDPPVISTSELLTDQLVNTTQEFGIGIDNQSPISYENVLFKFEIGAAAGDISLLKTFNPLSSEWVDLPYSPVGDKLVGYFGEPMALPANQMATAGFRLAFAKTGAFPLTVQMITVEGETETVVNSLTSTINVHNPPALTTIELNTVQKINTVQEFGIGIDNQSPITYENVVYRFEIGAAASDVPLLQTVNLMTGEWIDLPYQTEGGKLVGYLGEPMTLPGNTGGSAGFRLAFAKTGQYPLTVQMITVDGETETVINSLTTSIKVEMHMLNLPIVIGKTN